MSGENWGLFLTFGFFIVMLFIAGIYCMLVTRNILRTVLGFELMIKAVTLLIAVVGHITGQTALAQSLIITIIVIEVVFAATAGGVALRIFRHNDDLGTQHLKRLKG